MIARVLAFCCVLASLVPAPALAQAQKSGHVRSILIVNAIDGPARAFLSVQCFQWRVAQIDLTKGQRKYGQIEDSCLKTVHPAQFEVQAVGTCFTSRAIMRLSTKEVVVKPPKAGQKTCIVEER